MAFSLNKVMLIGNLGQDAEHRFTTNNNEVSTFSIATTHSYKGKDGNYVNETTWHNVVLWGASDFLKSNLKKGKKFYIEGRISKRDYENKDGQKIYVTEVLADKFACIPLDGGNNSSGGNFTSQQQAPSTPNTVDNTTPEEDDLPF